MEGAEAAAVGAKEGAMARVCKPVTCVSSRFPFKYGWIMSGAGVIGWRLMELRGLLDASEQSRRQRSLLRSGATCAALPPSRRAACDTSTPSAVRTATL